MDVDQFALANKTEDHTEDHKEGVAAFLERRKPRLREGRRDSTTPSRISVIRIRYIMEYLYLQLDQIFTSIFCQTRPARRLSGGCPAAV